MGRFKLVVKAGCGYEIWKDINNAYQVSDLGYVRSTKTGKIISSYSKKGTNYQRLCLYTEQGKKLFYVHCLVALAFPEICGEHFEGAQVDHKNGIQNDNRAINLRWVDRKTNMRNPNTYPKQVSASMRNLEIAMSSPNYIGNKWH